jgi:CRISPR-associated protein Csx14
LRVSVIAPIGTSPPVITEFLQYMIDIKDVTILSTADEIVTKSTILTELGLRHKYPSIKTHVVNIPFSDIESHVTSIEFIKIATRVLKEHKRRFNVDSILICIAGGRKDACVILSIIAESFDVSGVYQLK